MRRLIHEIHRRSLWQVLGIFLAASWVVLQVVDQLAEAAALPQWVPTFALVLLLIGLPVVLATAFVQEGAAVPAAPPAVPDEAVAAAVETGPQPVPQPVPSPARAHGLLTWRNAMMGGVLAFALLGVLTLGWVVSRSTGIGPAGTLVAKGVLEEKATILISEFSSPDSLLGRAATEAFTIDFADSRVVRVADPSVVTAGMQRMELEPAVTLDADLARQLAEREGIPAIVTGEITPAGSGYVLSARLISVRDGAVLAQQRQTAANEDEIIAAIDGLSKGMRERVGDPLRDIGSSAPLEQVTTADLEALRLYSQGSTLRRREGPSDRVEALMKEAIQRDSAFAMAWRGLALVYQNRGQEPGKSVEALTRTLEYQDRLTRRERHLARASYFSHATFEFDRATPEYEALLEMDPQDHTALNNLAVQYTELREFEKAEELFARAVAADSAVVTLGNLAEIRANLGRFEQASGDLRAMGDLFPESVSPEWYSAHVAATQGLFTDAIDYMTAGVAKNPGSFTSRSIANADLAVFAASRGELARAASYLEEARDVNAERGVAFNYLVNTVQAAWVEAAVVNDPAAALSLVETALERFPLASLDPLDRPYLQLAELHAYVGNVESARSMMDGFEVAVPAELRPRYESAALRARAAIALTELRPEEAVRLYRESDTGYCILCALPGLARALEESGDRAAAIEAWQDYVDTPWFYRSFGNQYQQGPRLGPSLEILARMQDEEGDLEAAVIYYARFVELWAEADDELQPRVEAARARLEEIIRERG
jgi:tetratricopeptide (TPR) repeat protein